MSTDSFDTQPLPPMNAVPSPGTVLGERYHLLSELGRGGMGAVFRADDKKLGREVAVKVCLHASFAEDARRRLLREARVAASLNHPNLVAVYDVGEHHGAPFVVMELVQGNPLGHNAMLSLERLVEVARQVCRALEHAHRHGVVHRDLKPDNVILKNSGADLEIKLADLGLALPVHDKGISRTGTIAGTVSYMAPEQALGKPVDQRADLYALGVMLYELATGRLPFVADDPMAVVSQHVHAPAVPPRMIRPDLPRALDSIILRLLAKDPARRFASAKETEDALAALSTDPRRAGTDEDPVAAVALLEALSRGRLVARTEEMAEARELWRRALDGQGHCLLISGEPGAGKTRLAREVMIQAAFDGAMVLSGACYENEATTPYLPFVEAVRRWVREQDDAALRQFVHDDAPFLAKLAPELTDRLGPFPPRPELSATEERLLFFDAVGQLFQRLAAGRGLVFYVDDLQWADTGTLALFSHLLRRLKAEPVFLLGSYRETELDRTHPLERALVDWNRERLSTRIALRRFTGQETRAQLESLLGEAVPPEFAKLVHAETEGNPFFVEEVLKALVENGSVRRENGTWVRCNLPELVVPQSMKAAIGARLDRVSDGCNDVLRAAAVLGKTFSFEEFVAVTGARDEEELLDLLDEAVAAQLLLAEGDDGFAFTHDKIREVLHDELNPIRRRRLHRRTAEGLEKLGPGSQVAVETLAHHFIEAGDYARGLEYAKQAAAQSRKVFAFEEAIAAYGQALECARALDLDDEEAGIQEAMGHTWMAAGEMVAASSHYEAALSLTTEPGRRARLQLHAAGSYVANGDQRGLDYVHQALKFLDPVADPVETATARAVEARFHHLAGRHQEAVDILLQAEALAKPRQQQLSSLHAATLSRIYAYLAGAHQHLALFDDADRWARAALEFGRTYQVPTAEALAYEFLGEDALNTGNWNEALEFAESEREVARRIHSRERYAWTYLVTGASYAYMGDLERGVEELRRGAAEAEAIGEKRLRSLLNSYLSVALARQGKLGEAEKASQQALALADELAHVYLQSEARRAKATVALGRGEANVAVRHMEEAHALAAGTEARTCKLLALPVHIEALHAAQDPDRARLRLDEFARLAKLSHSLYFKAEVDRLSGLLAKN